MYTSMKAARDYTNKMIQLEKERYIAWKAAMFADDDSPEYARYQAAKKAVEDLAIWQIRQSFGG